MPIEIKALEEALKYQQETQKIIELSKKAAKLLPELWEDCKSIIISHDFLIKTNYHEEKDEHIWSAEQQVAYGEKEFALTIVHTSSKAIDNWETMLILLEGKKVLSLEQIPTEKGDVIRVNYGPYEKNDPQKVIDAYELLGFGGFRSHNHSI